MFTSLLETISMKRPLLNFSQTNMFVLNMGTIRTLIFKKGAKYAAKKYLPPPSKMRGVTFHSSRSVSDRFQDSRKGMSHPRIL